MTDIRMFPGRVWFRFIESSILSQMLTVTIILLALTILYTSLVALFLDVKLYGFMHRFVALLLNPEQQTVPGLIGIIFYGLIVFIVAVWQAVFIAKILVKPHDYRFSNKIAFYPKNPRYGNFLERDEYIVFRIMNNGISDLFDVDIKVSFRNYNPVNKTFQHYVCRVLNVNIAVFGRGMPFRIYVHTGEIKINSNPSAGSIDVRFLSPFETKSPPPGMEVISIEKSSKTLEEHRLDRTAYMFIVYVSGYDVDHNQRKSATHEYLMQDIIPGYFREIKPRQFDDGRYWGDEQYRFFAKAEIDANFDEIDSVSELGSGDDGRQTGFPDERLRVTALRPDEMVNRSLQATTEENTPRLCRRLVSLADNDSIEPRACQEHEVG